MTPKSSKHINIDWLLNEIGYRAYKAGQGKDTENGDNLYKQSEIVIDRAKQQLKDLMLEIIGEDETYEGHTMNWAIEHHNHLRQEQRQKASDLFKGDKE